jgi:hypothetical protein
LIGGRRSDLFTARNLGPGNLGLLQQYRHMAEYSSGGSFSAAGESRHSGIDEWFGF